MIQVIQGLCHKQRLVSGKEHVFKGTVATGDQFVASQEYVERLQRDFDALACEMEGGSIAQVCYINKVPFSILRSISDDSTSDDNAQVEYNTFSRSAAAKAIEIITGFIENWE